MKYHAQIVAMQDKFPIYETGVRVAFSWADTFHPKKICTQSSWKYEIGCVLFNLAACQWQLATTTTRNSPAAIESVAKLFCSAAGVLSYIRDNVSQSLLGDIQGDLLRDGLNMQVNLALAQAQACYYERARSSTMKPELVSKIISPNNVCVVRCVPHSLCRYTYVRCYSMCALFRIRSGSLFIISPYLSLTVRVSFAFAGGSFGWQSGRPVP